MKNLLKKYRNKNESEEDGIKNESKFIRMQLRVKSRMVLYEKIGKFLENGVPLTFALDQIYKHVSNDGKKPKAVPALALAYWQKLIRNGENFSKAIDGWASSDEIAILNAGEISGRLDEAIKNVLFLYEGKKKVRSALSGIIYPLLLLACTCFFMFIFGTRVIPVFSLILPVEHWQGTGKTLAGLAYFVQNYLVLLIVGVFLLSIIIVSTFPFWCGRLRILLDKLPPWSFYRIAVGNGFLISLSSLLAAGVSTPEALNIMSKTAQPWYQERLLAIRRGLLNGAINIGEAIHQTKMDFPSRSMVMDIRSYAGLSGFEDMLTKLAHQWQEDSVKQIEVQMLLLKNVALVAMGIVFMWIVSGMFDLQQQISAAATATF